MPEGLSPIEDVIEDARNGHMFILVDDESRENEGDLVIPAQMATPEAINFMAKHGRGLICLALTAERVRQLNLPLMAQRNESRHHTAFTVSIEAREGVTTGISAADRAHTITVAIDSTKGPADITTPGHVFPLVARDGGVLVRAGHTEAAVDVSRLAGLMPAGVICEIMNDDGSMARLPDLMKFARQHKLKIGTIADLIAYRLRCDTLVKRVAETEFSSRFGGDFRLIVYTSATEHVEHVALVKGNIAHVSPVLVRMHALDIFHDVLGDTYGGRGGELEKALNAINEAGAGVVVLLRESSRPTLSDIVHVRAGKGEISQKGLRNYGIGAQILRDLGVKEMLLLTHAKPQVVGLEGFGLTIVGTRPL